MILADYQLKSWGESEVEPFNDLNVNPASLDLTLGDTMRIPMWYWKNQVTRDLAWYFEIRGFVPEFLLDKEELKKSKGKVRRFKRWSDEFLFEEHTLWPGDFVLCCSAEFTNIPLDKVATLFSKSSMGRIGLEHLRAGYGDPGFKGQWTFELRNDAPWPIKLISGMRVIQLVLEESYQPQKDYSQTGRYQGQTGATPAR